MNVNSTADVKSETNGISEYFPSVVHSRSIHLGPYILKMKVEKERIFLSPVAIMYLLQIEMFAISCNRNYT